MQRIVVLNPKGGSGKTTIAINVASYFAQRGERLVLMDYDPQGSSAHWLSKRQDTQPHIALIAAFERDPRITLLVVDPKNMFRWAQIQAHYADSTTEGADDHIERLSQRYTGGPYRNPKVDRLIVRLDLERVTGGERGTPWDAS